MLTDCPHCYKPMHEEADVCPHCTRYVPNASQLSSASLGCGEDLVKFGFYTGAFFFALGGMLDYLGWWRDWEMILCIAVALVLALVLHSKLTTFYR
jgi:hypothetical protein